MAEKTFMTMEGNEAAAYMAYPFTEVAAIYPITPSSPMATLTDRWSAMGRKNMFGQTVTLTEMQSEAGAIGAVHGAIQTGALTTSYTSSQGLMLMIPVLYRIAGERQPAVLHVAARTVGTHAMSIFGDHSDVMACRDTGWAQYCTASVQEIIDLAPVAHLAAMESNIPFMHFFDGFRTSHEIQKVEIPDMDEVVALMDKKFVKAHKDRALNPEHPTLRNTVQNPDVYFQVRESNNQDYTDLPDIVEKYFVQMNSLTGRDYRLFNYYGDPEATDIIVAMGSVTGAIQQTVDTLCAQGKKVGFIQVHLYRPFSERHLFKVLPDTCERIAVLDRSKNMGDLGEPLYQDICTAMLKKGKKVPEKTLYDLTALILDGAVIYFDKFNLMIQFLFPYYIKYGTAASRLGVHDSHIEMLYSRPYQSTRTHGAGLHGHIHVAAREPSPVQGILKILPGLPDGIYFCMGCGITVGVRRIVAAGNDLSVFYDDGSDRNF